MIQVKICGITNLDDALLCCKLGFNALGFIFTPKSKRYVTQEKVQEITKLLPPFIMKIGVFVDESEEEINRIAKNCGLNAVQLHNLDRTFDLTKIHLPAILATSYNKINKVFDEKVKYLVDTVVKNQFGGSGKSFDWNGIDSDLRDKIILAGGINSENIIKAIEIGYRYFDLSSSVEEYPGKKSEIKLLELHQIIKDYRGFYAKN